VLKSFPSLEKQLGLETDDDVRRSVFEELASEGSCSLEYADDVEPWIGDRAAVAIVDQGRPEPVVVLQVSDADRARKGLESVRDCVRESGQESGYVIDGDWAVLARTEKVARAVVEDAEDGSLAGDREFQELTGDAGEPGVVTLYAAPEAGPALVEAIERDPATYFFAMPLLGGLDPLGSMSGPILGMGMVSRDFDDEVYLGESDTSPAQKELDRKFEHLDELTPAEQDALFEEQMKLFEKEHPEPMQVEPEDDEFDGFPEPELPARLRQSLMDFSGLGGVVRFEDGGVELEMVSDRLAGTFAEVTDGEAGDDVMSELPDDTAIAFGAGLADDWVNRLVAQVSSQFGFPGASEAELIADFERETGLDVPGDVQDLAGDSVGLVAGADFDPEGLYGGPGELPVAARITGDHAKVEAALAKRNGCLK
jgi:hypothetical protein